VPYEIVRYQRHPTCRAKELRASIRFGKSPGITTMATGRGIRAPAILTNSGTYGNAG